MSTGQWADHDARATEGEENEPRWEGRKGG
jgi:hypothetical protein